MMDALDKKIIAATESGLPLVENPWKVVAHAVGTEESDVRSRFQKMLDSGAVRRIAAVPNHYSLGLRHNGMTVWEVDEAHISRLGHEVGALDFVSHCYRRPTFPGVWPFNLFAMVHGTSQAEVEEKAAKIRELLGEHCRSGEILYSTKILKKTGFRTRKEN